MKTSTKILISYALGQMTQILLHVLTINFNLWDSKRISFCAAGGFIVLFAAIAGAFIATDRKAEPVHTKLKTYKDWAKAPGKTDEDDIDEEVIFSAVKK